MNIDKGKMQKIKGLSDYNSFIKNNTLLPKLNNELLYLELDIVVEIINDLTVEDFNELKNSKIRITDKILKSLLKGTVVEDREKYSNNRVRKAVDIHNFKSPSLIKRLESKNIPTMIFSKDEILLKKMLQQDSYYSSDKFDLDKYKKGEKVQVKDYVFTKDAFSEEFNTVFIDYKENYNIYLNHPRIGEKKLEEINKQLFEMNKENFEVTFLVRFKNFTVEFKNGDL